MMNQRDSGQTASRLPLRENAAGRGLILASLALLALGVVMVHSALASIRQPGTWYARVDYRHTAYAVVAALVLVSLWRVNYRKLAAGPGLPIVATGLLVVSLICGALVFVPGIGHSVGGYARWIRIGSAPLTLSFQPSELIKISLVIFLASHLSRQGRRVRSFWRTFLPMGLVIAACVGLVITQDFGTAVVMGLVACVTLLLAGVPWYYLVTLAGPAAAAFYLFVVRSEHRWARIQAMMNPWDAYNPSTYQGRQSLLAILSGGWFGRGPGNGIRKLGYLPEDSTDFIFSVYCEEWGFVGAALLMGLLILWLWQARRVAVRSGDPFGRMLAGGLGFLIGLQAVMHIGVDVGLLPPTGMGMPFVSAGGTALVMMAAAAAMIVSVSARSPDELEAAAEARQEAKYRKAA
jgi:cell division protein FtsW